MVKFLLCLVCSFSLFSAEDIGGFWKTINEKTGEAQAVIAVYEHDGRYYGRIIGSYGPDGVMRDTIYTPIKRAPGLADQPFYSGLDIIWFLVDRGLKFKGKILDPEHGDVYNSELWIDNGNLVVRGKLLMFGRSQTWLPATAADFPKGFKMPDLKKLVPNIPNVK
jgi:uncharacterized protein (DUF2147 family)